MERNNELLCRLAKVGDLSARDELLENNLSFLRKLANDLLAKNADLVLEQDDLIQEGSLGLLRALDGFDPNRGFLFLTYAGTIIEHAMVDFIRREKRQFSYQAERDQNPVVSLYEKIHSDDETTERIQLLEDPFTKSPEQLYLEKETRLEVRQAVQQLEDRERAYIHYRFGLDEEDTERTPSESAERFRLPMAKARRLEKDALAQLRKNLPW